MSKWLLTENGLFNLNKFIQIGVDEGKILGFDQDGDSWIITTEMSAYWEKIKYILEVSKEEINV